MKSLLAMAAFVGLAQAAAPADEPMKVESRPDQYRGWETRRLANDFVTVHVAPAIGGRIIQYQLGGKEILWVNPELAGKAPTATGLGTDGGWLNYGGDKLWPAPQGWDNDEQWPGPPDGILDGSPHALEVLGHQSNAAVRLTSRPDPRSGIQFARTVTVFPGSTRVVFEVTMKNIDSRPRRWGIWTVTQLNGARADGRDFNPELSAYCPINPKSRYANGFEVLFGATNNPSFQVLGDRHMFQMNYQYRVGKVALDSHAGWTAAVDGSDGTVFVQRFKWEPKQEYPDGASVEFWTSGRGKIHAYKNEITMPENPPDTPWLIECELLSPFARLNPGEKYDWRYEWFASNIGGKHPVVDCTDEAIISRPLRVSRDADGIHLTARFGVFRSGELRVVFLDRGPRSIPGKLRKKVTPFDGVNLDTHESAPATATHVALVLASEQGRMVVELTRASLRGVMK